MSDIAARAGTTIGVVSVTLNGAKSKTVRVSDATRERVIRAAEELGYRRDPVASALVTGRSHVIGLMLPYVHSFDVPDPFYSVVTGGVAAVAARHGYNLMLYTSVAEEEATRAVEVIDRRIDGLILVIPPNETPIYEECRRQGIATVSITQQRQYAPATVNSDDYEGGKLATEHLISLGHRRIAHLTGRPEIHTSALRFKAFRDTLAGSGIEFDPNLVKLGGFSREVSRLSTAQWMELPADRRPTAIFAANDLSAHGAIDAISSAGFRVPGEISVIGYDDTWYASITNPPLTSVSMDIDSLGRHAAEFLIGTIEGTPQEAHAMLEVSLKIRRSTGPPPNATYNT
ncbi:MAG: LacI family DNA-binding transcriptional regulator [Fimbriimonas sp.]|nr:LacI family DNA-binding transcriptional regulator [Fimbriimonas sp.]